MKKRQIFMNAVFSVIQVVVVGIVLIILYRFLLNTIGVKQLGIWSLVLASASVAQLANFGLSGSVVKFVAKYLALSESKNVSGVIQTAVISLSVFTGLVLLASYPLIEKVLGLVVSGDSLVLAVGILPYALVSLWLMIIFSVFQAGLDGCQRIDLRTMILMGSSVLNLILCFVLAPRYGLMGVAYARVIQVLVTLVIGWILLKRYIKLPVIPCRWNRHLFGEIVKYGIKYQTISIATMFYDPTTKALLSKFGGLSMVGYYEMASRMIQQFRSVIVSANQVLFPAIADVKETEPERVQSVYRTSYDLLFYLALPMFSLIAVLLPTISTLWIGWYESVFVLFAALLTIGWFVNTLCGPAYFANLGVGELRWNVIGHVTMAVSNAGLGIVLGIAWGGIGVVLAWMLSLAIGSASIFLPYHTTKKIPLMELLPKHSRILLTACLTGVSCALIVQYRISHTTVISLIFLIVIAVPLWVHPMRTRLAVWIRDDLLAGK